MMKKVRKDFIENFFPKNSKQSSKKTNFSKNFHFFGIDFSGKWSRSTFDEGNQTYFKRFCCSNSKKNS